jgi:hypothetical protein
MRLAVSVLLGALVRSASAGATCAAMSPTCTDSGLSFAATVGGQSAAVGNSYGCLGSVPNPAWFYLLIRTGGMIETILVGQHDVDYALWGPYTSVSAARGACGTLPVPLDCSYSAAETERPTVPSSSVAGDVYVLLFTNYADTYARTERARKIRTQTHASSVAG